MGVCVCGRVWVCVCVWKGVGGCVCVCEEGVATSRVVSCLCNVCLCVVCLWTLPGEGFNVFIPSYLVLL